ncbi:MAG: hypothetical protein IIC83_04415 [Chloroflexi bacterium]|nr:hypothetical protein [Chloroflexota bacterium]MCH7652043.1 hypothetical protein [Chloroflexota bacterium]
MSTDNKVLSQDEIDAMLSGGSSDGGDSADEAEPAAPPAAPAEPAPVTAAPAAPAAAPPAPVAAAPALPDETREMLGRMSERLETLGAAMERIAQLERGLTETNSAIRLMHQDMQTMSGQVQLVSSRVEGILSNLKATLGYRAQSTYVCASCQTKGEVAAQVKCTHCGTTNWWGWWPSK